MTPAPEFARPYAIDQVGRLGETRIAADDAERAALAARFGLLALDRLEAVFTLDREAMGIVARGRVVADLAQPCGATGAPVPEHVDAPFTLRFLPADSAAPAGEEVELDADDCDTVFYAGGAIDMGEAAAETLALAMEPWPRAPDADAWLARMGVRQESDMSPFAALKGLASGKRDPAG